MSELAHGAKFPLSLFKRRPLPTLLSICFVARRFPTAGRASEYGYLWPVAKGLAKRGHRVSVITSDGHQRVAEASIEGVQFHFLPSEDLHSMDQFSRAAKDLFAKLHRQNPFHVVHSIDASAQLISRYKKDFNVSVAFDVGATQMSQLFAIAGMAQETFGSLMTTSLAVAYKFLRTYYGGDRKLIRTADGIFVTSPHERTILERYYLYPDHNIFSVPYGIEIGDLSSKEKSEERRKQLQIPIQAKTVVSVSDMTEAQPILNLLEAFEKVAVKNSQARMIIVGNGPKFKEIEYEMLSLALGSRVILTGAVNMNEVSEYIALADVYVNISSRTTGFEPSILEAMAQKKVIIASEVSPLFTLVEDGIDGFLVRPADIKSLANLLIDIFSDQVAVAEIGHQARRKIIDLFDTTKMVDETINSYFNMLKRTRRYNLVREPDMKTGS